LREDIAFDYPVTAFQEPDPGDENMSDADWDEWICNQEGIQQPDDDLAHSLEIENEMDRRFPIFKREVKDGLQTFVNTLSTITPQDPSITNANF
jgi:hypothetical protein